MRIDEILSRQAVQGSKQSNGSQSTGGDDAFAALLQSEIAGTEQNSAPDSAVCGPGSVPGLLSVQPLVSNSASASEPSQAISALDGVITQLESLQSALQGKVSPKEIDGLIEQINAQTASLDDKMSGLPADHKLRDLGEELKVTTYMESLKWKRGDYL